MKIAIAQQTMLKLEKCPNVKHIGHQKKISAKRAKKTKLFSPQHEKTLKLHAMRVAFLMIIAVAKQMAFR